MIRLSYWWHSIRPKTLFVTLSPICMANAQVYRHRPSQWSVRVFLLTWILATCIQIGTNWANDLYDAQRGIDTERRKGPERMVATGKISSQSMFQAMWYIFSLAFLLSLSLIPRGGFTIVLVTLLAILTGLLYSAGPRPISHTRYGELFAFFFFGPFTTGISTFLQQESFSISSILLGTIPGCFAAALLLLNNIRDRQEDHRAGKYTSMTYCTEERGKQIFCLLVSLPFFLSFLLLPRLFWIPLLFIPLMFPLVRFLLCKQLPQAYNRMMGQLGKINLLYVLLLCFGLI